MKTIISLLLLPIMAFAQPQGKYQKEGSDKGFSIDVNIESFLDNEIDFQEPLDSTIELIITLEIYIETLAFDGRPSPSREYETMTNLPPKYLNTLSLVGLYSNPFENNKPQERLNHLLSLNDARFPKENTLANFLHPVRYEINKIGSMENIPQGFGPLIQI